MTEVKNTLKLIEAEVRRSKSLKEARQRIAAEMEKGGYCIISWSLINQKIESSWQGKERAREKGVERLKERYERGR